MMLKYHGSTPFQDNLVFTVDSDIHLTGIGLYIPENANQVITAHIKAQRKGKNIIQKGEWKDLISISVELKKTSTKFVHICVN